MFGILALVVNFLNSRESKSALEDQYVCSLAHIQTSLEITL